MLTYLCTAAAQDPNLSDKVLIFTPDGKCVDYFVTEPPALLAANKRTYAASFVFGPKDKLYFPPEATIDNNNNNEFTGGCSPGAWHLAKPKFRCSIRRE